MTSKLKLFFNLKQTLSSFASLLINIRISLLFQANYSYFSRLILAFILLIVILILIMIKKLVQTSFACVYIHVLCNDIPKYLLASICDLHSRQKYSWDVTSLTFRSHQLKHRLSRPLAPVIYNASLLGLWQVEKDILCILIYIIHHIIFSLVCCCIAL